MKGGLLDDRESINVLAGLEKAAPDDSCSLRGVPGLELCGDGIRSRS